MSGPATLIAVADAMTAEIADAVKSGHFEGLEFTPVRSFADWEKELGDLDCLHVDCVPFNYDESVLKSRGTLGYLCSVSVVVRKRFKPKHTTQCGDIANEHVDRLVLLIEELSEFFIKQRLQAMPSAVWDKSQIIAAYDYDILRRASMFAGVVRITFEVPKALA